MPREGIPMIIVGSMVPPRIGAGGCAEGSVASTPLLQELGETRFGLLTETPSVTAGR